MPFFGGSRKGPVTDEKHATNGRRKKFNALALLTLLLSSAALILGFLCLFAGHTKSFLPTTSILTLNTSRIGANLLGDSSSSSSSSSSGDSIFGSAIDSIEDALESEIDSVFTSVAQDLGLMDFYAVHIMDYCWGYYEPGPVKNASVHKISQNVTDCSNATSGFSFDLVAALQHSLNNSVVAKSSTLSKVADEIIEKIQDSDLQRDLHKLRAAFKAGYILYIVALVFTVLLWFISLLWICLGHRLAGLAITIVAVLAFLFMGVASGLETAIAVKGAKEINKYGNDIGVSASRGSTYLGMTWAATACLLLAALLGCFGCFARRK